MFDGQKTFYKQTSAMIFDHRAGLLIIIGIYYSFTLLESTMR